MHFLVFHTQRAYLGNISKAQAYMLQGQSLCVLPRKKIAEEQFCLSKLLGTCFGGHILLASMTQNRFKCSIGILVLVYCHGFMLVM